MQVTLSYTFCLCNTFFCIFYNFVCISLFSPYNRVKGVDGMIWNERIKELRRNSHLTLKEVAARLGVTEGTAQRYENNIKSIPYEVIVAYSKMFGCSPAYIMGWDRSEKESPDFTPEEVAIIEAFRMADEIDRESVRRTLGVSGKNIEVSETRSA